MSTPAPLIPLGRSLYLQSKTGKNARMKTQIEAVVALGLLVGAVVFPTAVGAAQDGPVRQWLKERRLEKQQNAGPTAVDANTQITSPGDYSSTLKHGGRVRMYRVHVPATYNPAVPSALLFALHGGGGNMDFQADDARYGQIAQSEREGYVVVFPNGYSKRANGKFATWNAGKCCGDARDNNIDDVGFIRQIVANVTRQMNIDRSRIYATGMSNGAMMAYRLACEMSDVFAAIAPVAGTDNTRACAPKKPVSVLHFHAKNDTHVLFGGGAGPGARDKSKVTEFVSVPATLSKWAALNGCPASPRRVLEKPGVYCDVYSPCRNNTKVQLCVTERGGHSWPGAEKTRGEPASQAISANEAMWDFFKQR